MDWCDNNTTGMTRSVTVFGDAAAALSDTSGAVPAGVTGRGWPVRYRLWGRLSSVKRLVLYQLGSLGAAGRSVTGSGVGCGALGGRYAPRSPLRLRCPADCTATVRAGLGS